MKENALLVWRRANRYIALERTEGCRAQCHDVCRGMTAVIAGRVIFIGIWRVVSIADDHMVFSGFINMAVPCPHRPVADGTEYEPDHEKSFEHMHNLQQIVRIFKKRQPDSSTLTLRQATPFLQVTTMCVQRCNRNQQFPAMWLDR